MSSRNIVTEVEFQTALSPTKNNLKNNLRTLNLLPQFYRNLKKFCTCIFILKILKNYILTNICRIGQLPTNILQIFLGDFLSYEYQYFIFSGNRTSRILQRHLKFLWKKEIFKTDVVHTQISAFWI